MSTKTNDPKQTAPETEPVVDDIKTEPVAPDAEEKADKKTAQKEGKEKEPKASKEKKETKKEIEADLAAEKDKYLRLLAEYDNFRRRSARERENIYADVRCETLKKFLPVYDSLSRALAQTPDDDPARKGIEGIMNQYHTALNQLGVSEIEAVGNHLTPTATTPSCTSKMMPTARALSWKSLKRAFCIGDRVLRYSVVKVAN